MNCIKKNTIHLLFFIKNNIMNIEIAEKAKEILENIRNLQKYLFDLNNGSNTLCLTIDHNEFIKIESRYKYLFIQAIENKIKELKKELELL